MTGLQNLDNLLLNSGTDSRHPIEVVNGLNRPIYEAQLFDNLLIGLDFEIGTV